MAQGDHPGVHPHLFPYVYLYVSGALGSIDSSLEEAGENLGSSKLRRLFTVTLPVVMPSILAGAVMVFMTSLADFGTPMLLGEGKTRVLPVLVYDAYERDRRQRQHGQHPVGDRGGLLAERSFASEVLCSPQKLCHDRPAPA